MRAALGALALLLVAAPAAAQDDPVGDWLVQHRVELPRSGVPLELATIPGDDDPVRIELTGSYSFLVDGSEIDAMSATVSGRRDVAAGPFVHLPAGARVIGSDPVAHRYVLEVPRAPSMPIALNVGGLATRHLITATEARASLQGAIHVAHLVPPPSAPVRAAATATRAASSVPLAAWAGGGLGGLALLGLAFAWMRRRREPIAALLRRAEVARRAVAREVLAIGPAFDPVSASADRLLESAQQLAAHHRSLSAALARTAAMGSQRRLALVDEQRDVHRRLAELVARLEDTATQLAGRAADEARAVGVDRLVADLDADLDAAIAAEDELAIAAR